MEENFYATAKIVITENTKEQMRNIIKQLMALGAIDEETGESIIFENFLFEIKKP